MASTAFCLAKLVLTVSRVLLKQYYRIPKGLHRNFSNAHASQGQFQKSHSLAQRSELSDHTLIFNVEGALLKSSSTFPYFMLVAFEAGSIIRAFFLFILYPFLCLLSQELSLKIMIMVCFFGIKKESFRVGTAVLPKFFLEGVGAEGFEVLRKGGRKVGVSDLPRVMVESFLKDYLEIDFVVGRELKVCCGYYVGLMEEKTSIDDHLEEIFDQDEKMCCDLIGISSSNKSVDHLWFSHCKEIYLVNEEDKSKWHLLARDRYPKPLIFHDGRLAFRPPLLNMLAMFMWFPVGSILSITRVIVAISLPYNAAIPILIFTGVQLKLSKPKYFHSISKPKPIKKHKGLLYVWNHRTLLDPVFLSFGLKKPFAAVTYSLSRMSELLSPIRTVRLTRDRDQDAKMIDNFNLLNQGDLVVCPEGKTCREPYLLRFSPLFSELSDEIVPVGMDTRVSMFHGTTAGGLKFLDPFFFLMNPCPAYTVRFLDMVHDASRCRRGGATSSFEVANYVQRELGKALGFECTSLTRRDKYLILAGNEGIASGTGNR